VLRRLALFELWAGRKRVWLPGVSFSMALAALYLLITFEFRVEQSLETQGREILGADIEIEASRAWRQDERELLKKELPSGSKLLEHIQFNTMLQSDESRLVRLHAVTDGYPFYGKYVFEGLGLQDLNTKEPLALVHDELAKTLNLKIGSLIQLGRTQFQVGGILKQRPASMGGLFRLAPPVWIHERHLEETALLHRPGRVEWVFLIQLPSGDPQVIQGQISEKLNDPMLRFENFLQADRAFQNLYQQVRFFAQFVTVLALFLSGLSVVGGLQNWFFERRMLVASLRAFGATKRQLRLWIYSAVFYFGLVFSVIGFLLGRLLEFVITPILKEMLPLSLERGFSLFFEASFVALGVVSILLFAALAQSGVLRFRPLLLLRSEIPESSGDSWRWTQLAIWFLSIVALFWGVSFFILDSLRRATELTLGAFALSLVSLLISRIFMWGLQKIKARNNLYFDYSLRSVLRQRRGTLLAVSILFCVSSILSLLIVLQSALRADFELEEGVRSTVLFAFDLGDEEREKISTILKEFPDFEALWAPWVRVKWIKKNGEDFEIETSERVFDPTEFNLGVARDLPSDNRVVAGEFWTAPYQTGLPEISMTREFARQSKVVLGDRMTLDLWGVQFEALVTNLRGVRWTDFQPNFRVMIQEGYLEGLPFSFVTGLKAADLTKKDALQKRLMSELPAVSLIDLTEVKRDLVSITDRLTTVLLTILLFLTLLSFILMMALAQEKVMMRQKEFAQLKAFGASRSQLRAFILLEYLWITVLPSFLGLILGAFLGEFCLQYFFTMEAAEGFSLWLICPMFLGLAMALVAFLSSRGLLRARPLELFAD
jgi:putative ABC transport system permease protein